LEKLLELPSTVVAVTRARDLLVAPVCGDEPIEGWMSVDLMLPAAEKIVLVLEAIGDDEIRVNSSSFDHPLVILAGEALEIVGIEKKIMMGRGTYP
jgi:hypothetical protein